MPTINDIIDEYDELFYVKSGFDRFTKDSLLQGSNPVISVYNQPVVPINSVPIDADGDNDGVIDYYDAADLDGDDRTIDANYTEETATKSTFTVLKVFDEFEVGTITESHDTYSYPAKQVNISLDDTSVNILSVVKFNDEYFFKIFVLDVYMYIPYYIIDCKTKDDIDLVKEKQAVAGVGQSGSKRGVFNGWYIPDYGVTGVKITDNVRLPIYTQEKSKCTTTSYIMGLYYMEKIDSKIISTDDYYDDYMSKHWGPYPVGVDEEGKTIYEYGAIDWGTLRSVKTIDEIMDVVKKELDSGKPVIISGSSSSGDYIGPHYVLAVGYYNDGNNQSDYIIIDTEGIYIDGVYNKGSGTERMDIFYEHFPDETGKEGYKYILY